MLGAHLRKRKRSPCSTGSATRYEFKVYVNTVAGMAGGVLLNFGSAVTMPADSPLAIHQ